jgi:hypothetical protein
MQPYQQAGDEIQRQRQQPGKNLRNAGLLLAGTAIGGSGVSRIVPFLSRLIPKDLAIKGLEKVSPRLGKFIGGAIQGGASEDEVLDFVREKMEPKQEENAENGSNILGQYSPDLQAYIEEQIQSGKSPDHAAAYAMNVPELSEIVKEIEKKKNKRFTAIVRELYEGKAVGGQSDMQNPQQEQGGLDPAVAQILEQGKALLQQFKGGM